MISMVVVKKIIYFHLNHNSSETSNIPHHNSGTRNKEDLLDRQRDIKVKLLVSSKLLSTLIERLLIHL